MSGLVFSQEDNRYVYEQQNDTSTQNADDEYPAAPVNPTPIDDYIPVLFIIGLVIAVGVSMKKKTQIME